MPSDIPRRRLLVISDSPMYKEGRGYIAFEPVVRELEALAPLFEEIVWLGCRVSDNSYAMRCPATQLPIRIVAMPGVLNRYNVLRMFVLYPVFAYNMLKYARNATHIHTRGPSHPALLGIMLSMFSGKRHYWHKYAGNWIGEKIATTYKLQRGLLKIVGKPNIKVTVNGSWAGGKQHILSFENPCLSEAELAYASSISSNKNFSGKLNIVFAGNLMKAKGVLNLLEAVTSGKLSERFEHLYLAGDGDLRDTIASHISTNKAGPQIHLLGRMDRSRLNKLYETCHVVILPSESEGFPKVIAEGAAFGCVPVVTDVSSISQYIRHGENGYLLENNSAEKIIAALNTMAGNPLLGTVSAKSRQMVSAFTYERFVSRLEKEVFNVEQD